MIIASIFNYFLGFCLLEFAGIVFSAFLSDFDVFFSRYAKDHNHRNLITHSIIPSVILIIVGLLISWPALIISGIAFFIHVFVDLFDWGTNLFYFPKKTYGPRLLMSKEEEENLSEILSQYKNGASFFDLKYYGNKVALSIEALLFVLMIVFNIAFAFEYILISLLYFLGLFFHLSRHYHLKKIEAK